jgi:hypothetical protein
MYVSLLIMAPEIYFLFNTRSGESELSIDDDGLITDFRYEDYYSASMVIFA